MPIGAHVGQHARERETIRGQVGECWRARLRGAVIPGTREKNYKERAMYEMLSSRNEVTDFGQSGQQINIKSNNLSVDTN